jgi:hypothetical protein
MLLVLIAILISILSTPSLAAPQNAWIMPRQSGVLRRYHNFLMLR